MTELDAGLKAGLLAAKNWLFDQGYYELPGSPTGGPAPDLHGIKATSDSIIEVVVMVETENSLKSEQALERMRIWADWRLRLPTVRETVLFLPGRVSAEARLQLGLYREVLDF